MLKFKRVRRILVRKEKNPYYNGSPRNERYIYRIVFAPKKVERFTVRKGDSRHCKLDPGVEYVHKIEQYVDSPLWDVIIYCTFLE